MATVSRWIINQYRYSLWGTAKIVQVFTDVPCELTLYWNLQGVIVHPRLTWIRGMPSWRDPYLAFQPLAAIPQIEAGDSLVHTFVMDEFPISETRIYRFAGSMNGDPSPSVSPFFTQSNLGLAPILALLEPWGMTPIPEPLPIVFTENWTMDPIPALEEKKLELWSS